MQTNQPDTSSSLITTDYCFFMKKIQSTLPAKFVSIQFTPILYNLSTISINQSKIHPTYYHAKQPYFPTFILPIDQKNYIDRKQTFLQIHERKKFEALQQKQDLYVPMPSSKNKCCCVCRCYYEDYLTHIKSQQHKVASSNNDFNKDILNLCAKFDFPKKRKGQKLDNSFEFKNDKPRKRRKTDKIEVDIQYVKPTKMIKNNSQTMTSIGSYGIADQIDKNKYVEGQLI